MTQFAVCVNNDGYRASLEVGKLYQIKPDDEAASHGYILVIDESGEDYAYLGTTRLSGRKIRRSAQCRCATHEARS